MQNKTGVLVMLKEAGILFAITIIAGLALGYVYQLTKEPIAMQEKLKIENACKTVFADANSFEVWEVKNDAVTKDLENGVEIGTIYQALNSNMEIDGYVITTASSQGYGGEIRLMMGVKKDGTINGITILTISETPGLGMQAEDVLIPQFANQKVGSFSYSEGEEGVVGKIDAISGATITTKAVVNAVNYGITFFEQNLKGGE